MTKFKQPRQPENTLRRLIISQHTFCEEVLVFDREDHIDNCINVVIGYYENVLYLPFIIEDCFVNLGRINSFSK